MFKRFSPEYRAVYDKMLKKKYGRTRQATCDNIKLRTKDAL
jgi:hypothetical protein